MGGGLIYEGPSFRSEVLFSGSWPISVAMSERLIESVWLDGKESVNLEADNLKIVREMKKRV